MQKDYNKIQQACDRIFDASPLAVNFVKKVSTHAWAGPAAQGSRDQQWLTKQASSGRFKVGTNCRPPPLKASSRPAVTYMDMFGKRANTSTDRSLVLRQKSDHNLSSKKQANVPPQTTNSSKLSEPCITSQTVISELERLPGRYRLRTREHSKVGSISVNTATAKREKNVQPKPITKRALEASSLNKGAEQDEASQDDDDFLSNHSGVSSSQSSDVEQVIRTKLTATVSPLEVTGQNFVLQGDDDIDSHTSDGELESEGSSEEEEGVASNQRSEADKKIAGESEPSQVNSLASQSEVESETSSDEEGDDSKTGNEQRDTNEIDSDVNTESKLVNKEPEQRQGGLKILRLTAPEDTPKSVWGRKSETHRQRGSSNPGLDRSELIKTSKGSASLKSMNDGLNRRVRRKEKKLDTSKHKQTLDSLAQRGSEKDPLAVNDLPKTRSGRRVKPPLAWWAGQRVFVHPNADIVEIKPPTPSNDRDALSASMTHFKEDESMERSMRLASRKLLARKYKTKTSLNKSESLQMRSVTEGSHYQTCRRVKAGAYHNSDQGSGDERQSTQHSVSTPLSRSMPLYQSDGVHSEDDVLEKFDTPGLPKHLRNPPAVSRIRSSHFTARMLEVEDVEADDLCRSFGSTPVNQLVKQRTAKNRGKLNKLTELEEETLTRKSRPKISKPEKRIDFTDVKKGPGRPRKENIIDVPDVKRGPGRPRKTVTSETLIRAVQVYKTSKRRTRKQYASPVESDTESMQNGHDRHVYKKEKQTRAADYQRRYSDYSDEEVPSKPLTQPQRSNRKLKAESREDNGNRRVNSKTYKELSLSDSDDPSGSDEERKPAQRQHGKVTSPNERTKARAQPATGNKLMKNGSKSKPVKGKKQVSPPDIDENELQSSKTKTKALKDKENINVPSALDSVEDTWNSDEIRLYKQALRQLNLSMDNFWYHVALLVETKTAQQCQAYHQRSAPSTMQKKKSAQPPKANKGQKPGLTGKAGTLKRKRELKTMIEELNHNHEDDFFDATPVRQAKRFKLPTHDDEDDDDFYQNRPNTETPLSTRFTTPNPRLAWMPTSKTPVTSILSPSLTNTVDRKNTEAYVHRLVSKQHRRGTVVGKVVEEQETLHPGTHKIEESIVSQTLFKKDTLQEEDSEVEEDYYFSDCNE